MFKFAHISDVHFRSLKRHEEYKTVFKALFKKLEKDQPDIIFIGGDIVHSKTQGITPEIIDVLNWWFTSLANIAPTHVILGNHDGLILNEDRQDAISPIINALNNKNIFLYKNSGVYPTGIENINWCVFSCFDQKNWKNVKPVENQINIACFHGGVLGSLTDTDWNIDGEVGLDFFQDYDFTFLGDIHKQQYLDEDKRVAYPGSTVQQNYGEDVKKGYLLWNIKTKFDYESKFITIPNPHPFVTLDWKGSLEKTILFADKVKKGARFRIRSNEEISQAEIKVLHNFLKDKKNAHEIVYQILSKKNHDNTSQEIINNENKLNIRNKSDRLTLIKSYYDESLEEETIEEIDKVFQENLDKIPAEGLDTFSNKWTVNSMEWENTFSYGKNNYINFNNLSGVVGLFGNNRCGKSSIPGTLMYTLFNTTDRGAIKNQDIVNIRKGSCNSKVNFTLGTNQYEVERITTKKTNKSGKVSATTSLNLINLTDDNSTNETEEQRRETEKILRNLIGTSDDFLYTSFASQGEMNTFIKEKTSARKTVLSKFLNLQIYDKLYQASRDEYIVLKDKLKNISEKDWQSETKMIEEKIAEENNLISNIKKQNKSLREQEIELRLRLEEILKNTKKHPSGHTLNSAKEELLFIEDKHKNLQKNVELLLEEKSKIKENIAKIKNFKSLYPIEDLENSKDKLSSLRKNLTNFKNQKNILDQEKTREDSQLKILNEVPCDDMFPTCKFIKKAHEAKSNIVEITNVLKEVEGNILSLNDSLKVLEKDNIDEKIKKYNNVLNKEYKCQIDLDSIDEKIKVKKEALLLNDNKIESTKNLIEELKSYDINDLSLSESKIKSELNDVIKQIGKNDTESHGASHKIFLFEQNIKELEKESEVYSDLIKSWKIHDYFSNAVSKKGIPTMLINSYLPKINKEIEKILNGVVTFKVYLEDDLNNNNLNVFIDYGDSKRSIECASGMEKMITSIAIRVALINISALPRSDIFIIDEGFGALDSNNIESCGRLLISLKKYFKSIIVISHVDAIKDIVDKNIEITTKGMDSHVRYE